MTNRKFMTVLLIVGVVLLVMAGAVYFTQLRDSQPEITPPSSLAELAEEVAPCPHEGGVAQEHGGPQEQAGGETKAHAVDPPHEPPSQISTHRTTAVPSLHQRWVASDGGHLKILTLMGLIRCFLISRNRRNFIRLI